MKAFSIIIQNYLSWWSMLAEAAIKKGAKLLSNLKFLAKFFKVVSAHFIVQSGLENMLNYNLYSLSS